MSTEKEIINTIKCPQCGHEFKQEDDEYGEKIYCLYINGFWNTHKVINNVKYKEEKYYTKQMAINELTHDAKWLLGRSCNIIHGSIYIENRKIHTFKLYSELKGKKNE